MNAIKLEINYNELINSLFDQVVEGIWRLEESINLLLK